MIKSEIVKLKKVENFDNLYIEQELKNLGFDVVRWALIEIDDEFLTVSVSYCKFFL
jgi:hypothetical protein